MCGIVAIASRRSTREPPQLSVLIAQVRDASSELHAIELAGAYISGRFDAIAERLGAIDRELRGTPGLRALLADPLGLATLEHLCAALTGELADVEADLEAALDSGRVTDDVEAINAALVALKDARWAIEHDRVGGARSVAELLGPEPGIAAVEAFGAIQLALSAIDRLEVRGRDSAGIQLLVCDHGLDLNDPALLRMIGERNGDGLFTGCTIEVANGALSFVYKTAAEIGELGDNTAALRAQIRGDDLLRLALRDDGARALVVSHTRWASIGIISEANAHPLNSRERDSNAAVASPYVISALNGDVDNYADLSADEGLRIASEITTDAKVIPVLVARRLSDGAAPVEAFRATVAAFEGSVAIAAATAAEPDLLFLAQRGSGQALYVGMAEDTFIVASEPYGIVALTDRYVRLDGETMRAPDDPASKGQIVVVDARLAGDLDGIRRFGYDGTELPISLAEVQTAQMTTRDVDRGDASHYFWKEITEAPASFRKTLRGKIVAGRDGTLGVQLGHDTIPVALRERLGAGAIRRVYVIGQGTAAVAGQSLAGVLGRIADDRLVVEALAATELSGFALRDDMSDSIVIAISQSGTTTDTNRTVDLARSRGATVLAIVNRRQSDLVDKSDGVLYTSDGRDVEMAVASTKAFYAQIAGGVLLAYAVANALPGGVDARDEHEALTALRALPDAMTEVVGQRSDIAAIAQRYAPYRRSWTVVGNGPNRVAAEEARIKLSELCYKSIGCDTTEDKKHIDLSAEPLILVCAAGLSGSNADDVGKEVAIFRAHKAAPIVIATRGESRFGAALDTIFVPSVHPRLDFVLSAMAGHIFGYEAALAIDSSAHPLREARGAIDAILASHPDDDGVMAALVERVTPMAMRCFEAMRAGAYDSAMEAATAVRLVGLLRFAVRTSSLDAYQIEFGKVGTPSTLVEDLMAALTCAIDELTRPVDAIKHQAKTVTVGISRSDESLVRVALVQQVLATGCARDSLSYRALRTLVELDAAVDTVVGYTRYRIEGDVDAEATVHVIDRGGVASAIQSRTDGDPRLRGTKHRAAFEREVTVVRGRADGRTVIHVPEVKGTVTTGLTLLHVRFHERLPAETARRVLRGYRGRYAAIQDQVTETEPTFRDELLGELDLVDLLTEPVVRLAEYWRTTG